MTDPLQSKPIVSIYANHPDLRESIHKFVLALGDCIDSLQDAETQQEWKQAEEIAGDLGRRAVSLGFAPLARAAVRVETSCRDEDGERVHQAIVELTDVIRQIRQGHSGVL